LSKHEHDQRSRTRLRDAARMASKQNFFMRLLVKILFALFSGTFA